MANWATKESFFNCKVPKEKLTVPELGDICILGLTCGQKDDYENDVVQLQRGDRNFRLSNARARLMQLTIYDQHGKKMFTEKDIGRLCEVPATIVDPILIVAKRLSGMATGEIEELVKNSQTAREPGSEDSGSDSPRPSADPNNG